MTTLPCKICLSATMVISDAKFKSDYYLCPACHYIFLDPRGIILPEKEVELYNLHNNSLANQGYVKMLENFIAKSIAPHAHGIQKALDFGSGPGPVLAVLLQRKGFLVDIYDPYFSPQRVYHDKTYDLITSTEVFEHLQYPKETAAMLVKHLNPHGLLAIMTLFHAGDAEDFKKWWYRRDPTHISFYSPKTLQVLADLLGLKVLLMDAKNICVLGQQTDYPL
jgi:hypothetical protein